MCELIAEKGFKAISIPKNSHYALRWYDEAGEMGASHFDVPEERLLHIRRLDEAVELFESGHKGYALVITDEAAFPLKLKDYRSRIIQVACASEAEKVALRQVVQEVFLHMLEWENRLHFITETNGSLQSLLNEGVEVFKGTMFLIGIDYNVVGHSSIDESLNETYRAMLGNEDGVVVDAVADLIADCRATHGRTPEILVRKDAWGNICMAYPTVFNGSLFGALVLVLPKGSAHAEEWANSPGYRDQFGRFAEYVILLAKRMWGNGVELDMPHYYFFSSLLKGEVLPSSFVESNMHDLGIPADSDFKVVVADVARSNKESARALDNALRNLNNHQCFSLLFEDYLVAILYSNEGDGALSHRKTLADVDKYLYQPFGIQVGISQVFQHITSLRLGFRQAKEALACYDDLMRERLLDNEEVYMSGISFEEAMPYSLIKEDTPDFLYREFCLSYSPLEKLVESDLENGTHDFELLWLYLSYERSASQVSRRMFMHRNSVLYHIKQIEQRFDIDLSDIYCREKLMHDYRYLFTRMSDETLKKLFS